MPSAHHIDLNYAMMPWNGDVAPCVDLAPTTRKPPPKTRILKRGKATLTYGTPQAIKSFEKPENLAKRAMVRRLPIRQRGLLAHPSQRVRLLRKRSRMQRTHLKHWTSTLPHTEVFVSRTSPQHRHKTQSLQGCYHCPKQTSLIQVQRIVARAATTPKSIALLASNAKPISHCVALNM